MPRLDACWFPSDDPQLNSQLARMARVLNYSARQHCAAWDIQVREIPADRPKHRYANASHGANTRKLEAWTTLVQAAPDGAEILLLDVDTFLTRPLDDLWTMSFDLAYTVRQDYNRPLNSGVVAMRVSDPVRAFIQHWAHENRRMYDDRAYHAVWKRKYGGINQAAFGKLLEQDYAAPATGLNLLPLPCLEWNCEDSSWAQFDPDRTRLVHVKSALRRAVFQSPVGTHLRELARLWRSLEVGAAGAPGGRGVERANDGAEFH